MTNGKMMKLWQNKVVMKIIWVEGQTDNKPMWQERGRVERLKRDQRMISR